MDANQDVNGIFQFNDGFFKFWAVFSVVRYPNIMRPRFPGQVLRYLGTVRIRVDRNPEDVAEAKFPDLEIEVRPAWRHQINRWRQQYPYKILYKAPYRLNRAICRRCMDVVESMSVHNYVQCRCGKMAVDGGYEYRRRAGSDQFIEEMP